MRVELSRRPYQHVDMPYQHVEIVTAEDLSAHIRAVNLVCRRGIDEPLGRIGMTVVNWFALQLIARNPQARQRQLARLTGHSDQAFAALLARMVTYQFIARRPVRGRVAIHELTPMGRDLLQMGDEIVDDVLWRLFGVLNESERALLQALLKRVLHAQWRLRLDHVPKPAWYNDIVRPPP
jgi:DNA-binding MarR family transcriptional regulator